MAEGATIGGGAAPGLLRRLVPALLSAGAILPLGLALNYALNVALARALPVEGYGVFAYAQSLATVLALGASLGFSTSMMRFVAAYRANNEGGFLRGLIRVSFRLILGAGTATAVLLLALAHTFPSQQSGLFWAAVLLLPLTVDVWRESAMRGLHRTTAAILPRQVLLPALVLACVLALGLANAQEVLLVFVGILVLLEIAGLWQFKRSLALSGDLHLNPISKTKEWLGTSLPMAGANLMQLGITRWDVVIVGAAIGMEAAGPYAAAARTALLASLVLRVVNLVIGPMLAEFYHSGDLRRFRKLIVAAALGSGAAGLPLYLPVMLYPKWVLGFFGSDYQQAAPVLQILATGQFINLVTGPCGLALTMSRHERMYLWLAVASAATSLLALIWLTPRYGAMGAAFATAFAVALVNLAQAGMCVRAFGASKYVRPETF